MNELTTLFLGAMDNIFIIFICVVFMDYLSGITLSLRNSTLNLREFSKTLFKIVGYLLVFCLSVFVGYITKIPIFTDSVLLFFIMKESISILKNVSGLGIIVPKKLMEALRLISKDEAVRTLEDAKTLNGSRETKNTSLKDVPLPKDKM